MRPTAEQETVARAELAKGDLYVVNAYAGTGKTTTLTLFAEANPDKRILYICYNRDLAQEAKGKFPRNVDCRTVHSLGFREAGIPFKHKLGAIRPMDIMRWTRGDNPMIAAMAVGLLNGWLCSRSRSLEEFASHTSASPDTLAVSQKAWKMATDLGHAMPMPHDGYMKLWSLGEPVLPQYDVILLDEAQDSYPITVDFVMRHRETRSAAVVMVGDTHQSIYGWRNAVNAIPEAMQQASQHSSLTQCFRLSQRMADAAAAVLNAFKGDPVKLTGKGGKGGAGPRAVVGRTNASLIEYAIQQVMQRKSLHFAATTPKAGYDPTIPYMFDACYDVLNLCEDNPHLVKLPFYKQFKDYGEVLSHTKDEDGETLDAEVNAVVNLVERYGDSLPMWLDSIKRACTAPEKADVVLSSAHRAKGQEWREVEILEGFMDPVKEEDRPERDRDKEFFEEVNLLYVALTRSKGKVKVPPSLYGWLWGARKGVVGM
jgi:superfamily I DNA/RNA helicase